jgi:hypothetical protein
MLPYIPFLIGPLSFGIIALLIFGGSTVVFTIPVMASRGNAQKLWFAAAGLLLTVEAVALAALGVLVSNGTVWN